MRTTLTLDDEVAAKLKAEARRIGRPFRKIVNEALRDRLASRRTARQHTFRVTTRDLGDLKPGLSLDNTAELNRAGGTPAPSMILIDANLLFYAYHPKAEHHEKSRAWLEATLSGVGACTLCLADAVGLFEDRDKSTRVRPSAFT